MQFMEGTEKSVYIIIWSSLCNWCGGRSVGIVRSWTQTMGFVFVLFFVCNWWMRLTPQQPTNIMQKASHVEYHQNFN
jgi:hypothetical protein